MEVRRAAALTLMTCALAWSARAETESIALDYRASRGCPGRDRFVEEVRALTTKAELVEATAALRQFRVEALRKGNSVTGRLTIVKDGEVHFEMTARPAEPKPEVAKSGDTPKKG